MITKIVAAKITGILRRFEKKTVKFLLNPKKRRKIIMEPDLLTPGINARHWKIPANKDVKKVISSLLFTVRQNLSKTNKINPKKILDVPIIKKRVLSS